MAAQTLGTRLMVTEGEATNRCCCYGEEAFGASVMEID
jgi:hypothetical protein